MSKEQLRPDPLVSIIIPCWNIEKRISFLKDAISSILHQSYTNYEIIIVENGSPDNTDKNITDLLKQHKDTRLVYKKLDHNYGTSIARNLGVRVAKGEYLAFLDDDDIYMPDHLETAVRHLIEHPQNGVTFSYGYYYYNFFGLEKVDRREWLRDLNNLNYEELANYYICNSVPGLVGSALVMRKNIFLNHPALSFSEFLSKKTSEDVDFAFKILLNGIKPFFITKPTVIARSYFKYQSRSRRADEICDMYEVYNYILKNSILPLIKKIRNRIPEKRKYISKSIRKQRSVRKIQSLMFKSRFLESISYVLSKPYLWKDWVRYYIWFILARSHLLILKDFYHFVIIKSSDNEKSKLLKYLKWEIKVS